MVGYRGSMDLIFEIANTMLANMEHHHAGDWPLTPEALRAASRGVASAPCGGCAEVTPVPLAEASV